jgi:hypothetical protein
LTATSRTARSGGLFVWAVGRETLPLYGLMLSADLAALMVLLKAALV